MKLFILLITIVLYVFYVNRGENFRFENHFIEKVGGVLIIAIGLFVITSLVIIDQKENQRISSRIIDEHNEKLDSLRADTSNKTLEKTTPPEYSLELIDWHWNQSESGNYIRVEGIIKNISEYRMEYVQAVATLLTKDGEFITSDNSYIEYTTLMPQQTSPFSVLMNYNPLVHTVRIEFKGESGYKLSFKSE